MVRAPKKIVIPLPKVKERGVMPPPGRAIPDRTREESRKRCRGKVAIEPEEGENGS